LAVIKVTQANMDDQDDIINDDALPPLRVLRTMKNTGTLPVFGKFRG
jgi:hypothetical protein